jgi:hypothetical protein
MSDLFFNIDVKDLTKSLKEERKKAESQIINGVRSLASMTHAKLQEEARDSLGSLSKKYQNAIEFINPEENLWIVNLKEEAMFIEEGRKSGFMSELLSGRSSKVNKKGERYAIIPFEHSKSPSEQSQKARKLSEEIKTFLKGQKVSWKKIEYNSDGSPRIGLLHRFNVESARPTPHSKDPALKGVAIYQNKKSDGSVRRDVMTFRIITEKHREQGKWFHPGMEGKKLMDKVFDWAIYEWEQTVLPSILKDYE